MKFTYLILILISCVGCKNLLNSKQNIELGPLEHVQAITSCDSLNSDSTYIHNYELLLDSTTPIPKTILESIQIFDSVTNDYTKHMFSICDPGQFHFGLGMWIRNNWQLWAGGELAQEVQETFGTDHPDNMSSIILGLNFIIRQDDYLLQEYLDRQQAWYGDEGSPKKLRALKISIEEWKTANRVADRAQ